MDDKKVHKNPPPVKEDEEVSADGGDQDSRSSSTGSRSFSEPNVIGSRENRLVNRSKLLMYSVILLSAAIVGGVTYWFMEGEEQRWYEDEFEEFSESIMEGTEGKLEKVSQVGHALAASWTSAATHQDQIGANVTVANFGAHASDLASLGGTLFMGYAPLIEAADRFGWEAYAKKRQGWIAEDLAVVEYEEEYHGSAFEGVEDEHDAHDERQNITLSPIPDQIVGSKPDQEFYLPIWQIYPAPINPAESPIMLDLLSFDWFLPLWEQLLETRGSVYSPVVSLGVLLNYTDAANRNQHHEEEEDLETSTSEDSGSSGLTPKSLHLQPIFKTFNREHSRIVGVAISVISWSTVFSGLVEDEAEDVVIDLEYHCPKGVVLPNHAFETTEDEDHVAYIGVGFDPNKKYLEVHQKEKVTNVQEGDDSSDDRRLEGDDSDYHEDCNYYVSVYMTEQYVQNWQENDAVIFTIVVCCIFVFTAIVFFIYDFMVTQRNNKVVKTAERSNAIVTSLFPKNVAQQMMQDEEANQKSSTIQAMKSLGAPAGRDGGNNTIANKKPIADLFKNVTIMFGDISGFTAWSSMREPAQVFRLLETIFNAYDEIAEKQRVFKVETVGDCYVAVAGLPDPCSKHAVVMARFAWDCLVKMGELSKSLEAELGPDTRMLSMRFGLHSGTVTAGVLRGQRARFQLFGDAMNRTSRIETSGKAGRVHLSKETADLLMADGKGHWLEKRRDAVSVKGLGELTTYWLTIKASGSSSNTVDTASDASNTMDSSSSGDVARTVFPAREQNLVSWHADLLSSYLQKIIAFRNQKTGTSGMKQAKGDARFLTNIEQKAHFGQASVDHCISFPVVDAVVDAESIVLDSNVKNQLRRFVEEIADLYNISNPFHNFEHASHVVMSVTKLMSYIESSSNISLDDPLTQFVAVLAALVHDLDHPGVGNAQLCVEKHNLTMVYENSPAERNSLDLTWDLLRRDDFIDLRRTIYQTPAEFGRFRELLVHCLLVTDIMDKEQQLKRKERWESIFGEGQSIVSSKNDLDLVNMQKTALLEHVIQASDVAHTMQHWTVYQRWNRRLFNEMDMAFQAGRGSTDPAANWYEGEMGFFDFYIIPLAERLKKCPAFGASGDELLQYATSNRKEWEVRGRDIVRQYAEGKGSTKKIEK